MIASRGLFLGEDLVLGQGSRTLADPAPGEALVRVEWALASPSDLAALRTGQGVDHWPATLGEWVSGRVQDCPGGELAVGDLVVPDPAVPCRSCAGCTDGDRPCLRPRRLGRTEPGGWQEFLLLPVAALHRVDEAIDPALAALLTPLAEAVLAFGSVLPVPRDVLLRGYGVRSLLLGRYLELSRPELTVRVCERRPARQLVAAALGMTVAAEPAVAAETVDVAGVAVLDGDPPVDGDPPAGLPPDARSRARAEAVRSLLADGGRYRVAIGDAVTLDEAADGALAGLAAAGTAAGTDDTPTLLAVRPCAH